MPCMPGRTPSPPRLRRGPSAPARGSPAPPPAPPAPPAPRPRRGTSRPNDNATPRSSCSLEEPAPILPRLAKDDDVAAIREDELEVAAAKRLRRPPSVLHEPLLSHRAHRNRLDEPGCPIGARLDLHRLRP